MPRGIIRKMATSKGPIDLWRPYYKVAVLVTGIIIWTAVLFVFKFYNGPTIYTTKYGETKNIILPDGSTVTMNANSNIRYIDNWQQTHVREVWLSGEAFFDVLRKTEWKHAKFIVHTQNLNVEVLGTKFNVNNRRGVVKVVLNSGKVKLNQGNSTHADVVMRPKDLVEFNGQNKAFVKKIVEPENYISWMNHKLIFNETPVSEIAQVLEDTYGMKVILKDPQVGNRKFTGSVPNKQISLLLNILSESLNIKITADKQTILMSNN
jgi:ferric-dicitrate binding protein FerR (iron transport regulator)